MTNKIVSLEYSVYEDNAVLRIRENRIREGFVFSAFSFILLYISLPDLYDKFITGKDKPPEGGLPWLLLFFVVGLLLILLAIHALLTERQVIVDKVGNLVSEREITGKKTKSEKSYHFSRIKEVEIYTNSYNCLLVFLVTNDENKIKIISGKLEATRDHRNKISIANQLATLLNVPIVEKFDD